MKTLPRRFTPGPYHFIAKNTRTGRGLFAQEDLPRGACLIEYIGRPATPAQMKANTGKYLFWTSDTTMIDGNIKENLARFINHSCRPNCEVDQRGRRLFIFAKRLINADEELTYDYGDEYFAMYFSNGRCRCEKCESLAQAAQNKVGERNRGRRQE